jgi:DNA-binding winged helix-turn-helix (wHTH) protein
MPLPDKNLYQFEDFQLNPEKRQLTRNGRRVVINPKAFDLLVLLVQNHEKPVTKDEMREKVWHDSLISDARIFAQIKKIRRILGKRGRGRNKEEYIEALPGEGYQFVAPVRIVSLTQEDPVLQPEKSDPDPPSVPVQSLPNNPAPLARGRSMRKTILFGVIAASVLLAVFWGYKRGVEAEIRHVIQDSQIVETLQIYTNPAGFDKGLLGEYWVSEEQGGVEITKVKATVDKLLCEGTRYGKDAKLEHFRFRYVRVSSFGFGKTAFVGTDESWYLPKYKQDGGRAPQEEKNVYMKTTPDYELHKVNGKWLIMHSGVPRKRSVPCPRASLKSRLPDS